MIEIPGGLVVVCASAPATAVTRTTPLACGRSRRGLPDVSVRQAAADNRIYMPARLLPPSYGTSCQHYEYAPQPDRF